MSNTVTVARKGKRLISWFSAIEARTFGPWEMDEMVRDLRVSALLPPLEARDLCLEALAHGHATREVTA